MNDLLKNKLQKLHLSGFVKTTDMRVEQAIKEKFSYVEFLEMLVNDEYLNRANNSNIRRFSKAKFPQSKTIEEFNFSAQPSINRQDIYNLATCEFIRKKENVAFIGTTGTGKTHLSIALGTKAILQGYKVLFTTMNNMLEELYISRADNSFNQKLRKYSSVDLLIIDELGLKRLNQNSVDDFYEIISRRYERSSTIITSNKKFDDWGKILFDPILASAILDRFVHHCNFISIDGDSYRTRERIGVIRTGKRGRPRKVTDDEEDTIDEQEGDTVI